MAEKCEKCGEEYSKETIREYLLTRRKGEGLVGWTCDDCGELNQRIEDDIRNFIENEIDASSKKILGALQNLVVEYSMKTSFNRRHEGDEN